MKSRDWQLVVVAGPQVGSFSGGQILTRCGRILIHGSWRLRRRSSRIWSSRTKCGGIHIFLSRSRSADRNVLAHFQDLSTVAGAIPGTCCGFCTVAVFRLTGRNGGFLFAPNADSRANRIASATNTTRGRDNTSSCHAHDGPYSITG